MTTTARWRFTDAREPPIRVSGGGLTAINPHSRTLETWFLTDYRTRTEVLTSYSIKQHSERRFNSERVTVFPADTT